MKEIYDISYKDIISNITSLFYELKDSTIPCNEGTELSYVKTTSPLFYNKVIDANPFRAEAYNERGQLRMANGDNAGKEDIAYAAELQQQQAQQGDKGEDIEQNVKENYKNADPYGIFG